MHLKKDSNPIDISRQLMSTNAPTGGGRIGEVVGFGEESGRVLRMFIADTYLDRVIESNIR